MRVETELKIIWAAILLLSSIIWALLVFNTPLCILSLFEKEISSETITTTSAPIETTPLNTIRTTKTILSTSTAPITITAPTTTASTTPSTTQTLPTSTANTVTGITPASCTQIVEMTANGKYHIQPILQGNWYTANAYCHSIGMNLIDVSTKEKYDEVVKTIKDAGYGETFWTSGTRVASDQFYWFNTGEKFNFTNWYYKEPNNWKENEKCMSLWLEYDFQWNDDNCELDYKIMCEKSDSTQTKKTPKIITKVDKKYVIFSDRLNWNTAHAFCRSIGMHLIEISTKTKQDDVVKTIKDAEFGGISFWTSGRRLSPDQFYWSNNGNNFSFTHWADDEPNNYGGHERCMTLWNKRDFKWNDEPCSYKFGIICE